MTAPTLARPPLPGASRFIWDDWHIVPEPTGPASDAPEPEMPAPVAAAAKPRALYREDQERDESGRFAPEGGGTESTPAARAINDLKAELGAGGRFETREQRTQVKLTTEQRLATLATGTGPQGWSNSTIMAPTPNLIRAGERVATLLEQMKGEGLAMPTNILIRHTEGSVAASVRGNVNSPQRALVVEIPSTLPDDADLDDAVMATFSGKSDVIPKYAYNDTEREHYDKFTIRTMRDVVTHEMGHVQAGHRGALPFADLLQRGTFGSTDAIRRAAMRVSEYALSNQDEFIAETFTRLYRGETLSEDSLKLYQHLNGPKIR